MTTPSHPEADTPAGTQAAWLARVRARHRGKQMAGVVGCLIGVVLMVFGRFRPDLAPPWALGAGLAVVGLSWGLFGWVIHARWRWAKAHPFRPPP